MKDRIAGIIGCILLVLFSLCIAYGNNCGEKDIVFQNASQICMECIGIG